MGDLVKIGVKTGLIAVITAAVIALFASIQIPAVDTTLLVQGLGSALAVIYHYVPIMSVIVPVAFALLSFELAYYAFQLASIAIRWIMKVNE